MSTGEHAAVTESKDKPPTVAETVWAAARWLAGRELLMRLVLVGVLLGIGAAGVVWAQDTFDGGLAPLREELAKKKKTDDELHAKQALEREQDRAELAAVKIQSAETMLNMRLVVERLNMKPIILVEQPDGGR